MLVLEKQEKYEGHQQFFAVVLLIGTRKQAENFAYRLELNGNRRRLTWEATPRSIHDGVAAAIMNSDCLVFDTSIAHLFADNGNLGINVTISMCWRSRAEPPVGGGVKEVQSAPADSLGWSRSRSRLSQQLPFDLCGQLTMDVGQNVASSLQLSSMEDERSDLLFDRSQDVWPG